jgi:hypothetical protein
MGGEQKARSIADTVFLAHFRALDLNLNCKGHNGVAPLAMPQGWRTVLKQQQAEKIP